ncbi:hypothetical protein JW935_01695 [candidate division KSB1 bacterium]|nr:hypothetical protein [candidate division KSB1 bacterium]
MKAWKKSKASNLGETVLAWRHRANNRFLVKLLSWLLGAYVFAILASIIMSYIPYGLIRSIEKAAPWIVFVSVYIWGVYNSFMQFLYNGAEYRIMKNGLAQIRPVFGFELPGLDQKDEIYPYGKHFEFLSWNNIKELKIEEEALNVILKKQKDTLVLGVSPVVCYFSPTGEVKVAHKGLFRPFEKDEEFDRNAVKFIITKARETKKEFHDSN